MTTEENKVLGKRFIDGMNAGDLTVWDKLCAPEFVMHVNTMDDMTLEQSKQFIKTLRAAFPDESYTIEDMIAEGNKIVMRFTWRGTHKGVFMGIPPTGKRVSNVGLEIDRISKGKFVETWFCTDMAGLMAQLSPISSK